MKAMPFRMIVLALGLVVVPVSASAQLTDTRSEAEVESFGLDPEEQRTNLVEEAREGPQTSATLLEDEIDVAEIERTETALNRLEGLVDDTPPSDIARAEYMFRLAELYYDRARYYEQRAFRRRDEAYELRETNPARSGAYLENADADLDQSDIFANEAIRLYAEIYDQYYDTYPDIDAVLYYLGANMLQLEQNSAARMVFEDLALNFPRSEYLPQALLMLGELLFVEGEMQDAEMYYEAVTNFPESATYSYALYKLAWCTYNLAEGPDDYESAMQLLFDSITSVGAAEGAGQTRLRRDALRDLTLFYSEVYPADLALDFFTEIAPDEAYDLVARLARIYGDRASYEDSNTLYRTLIGLNSESFDVVSYQREIVRNTRPLAVEIDIVREVRRLVEIFELAQSYEDAEPVEVARTSEQIELLLRQLATTYHSEAQTTQNAQLYALAYTLYEDYTRAFPEGVHAYTMWFYFAELLYRNHDWQLAAEAYEAALALSGPEQNQYDQEATYAACLAYANMVDLSAASAATTSGVADAEGELPPIPEPREIPEPMMRMMTACDRYLATGPDPELAAEIEYVVAYTYYDYDHLTQATERFAELAVGRTAIDAERGQMSAQLLLDSFYLLHDLEAVKEWIDRFRSTPSINSGDFAVDLERWSSQIDFEICRVAHADAVTRLDKENAGHCFIHYVESHIDSELVDKAFFNAALAFEQGDKLDYAISAHRYLIEFRPDSTLVPETMYYLARLFHRMAMYDQAAQQYEDYVDREPGGEHIEAALINASQFRSGLGDHGDAIEDFNSFIRVTDEDAASAEAYFQIGLVEERRGREDDAVEAFERVIRRYSSANPSRALEAHGRIADIYLEGGGRNAEENAYEWYARSLEFFEELNAESRAMLTAPALDVAAKAQFMMGEQVFREFEAVEMAGSEEEVQEGMAQKIEIGRQATDLYVGVIDYGRPGWAIAAFTRLGQLYHVFYEQLIDTPVPPGLTPVQTEVYLEQITERAEAQKYEAMDRYAQAIMIAREYSWFNEYSELAAERYTELDPTFQAGNEVRIEPGFDAVSYSEAGFNNPFATAAFTAHVEEASLSSDAPGGVEIRIDTTPTEREPEPEPAPDEPPADGSGDEPAPEFEPIEGADVEASAEPDAPAADDTAGQADAGGTP